MKTNEVELRWQRLAKHEKSLLKNNRALGGFAKARQFEFPWLYSESGLRKSASVHDRPSGRLF